MKNKVKTENIINLIKMRLGLKDLSIGEFIIKLEEAPLRNKVLKTLNEFDNLK